MGFEVPLWGHSLDVIKYTLAHFSHWRIMDQHSLGSFSVGRASSYQPTNGARKQHPFGCWGVSSGVTRVSEGIPENRMGIFLSFLGQKITQ